MVKSLFNICLAAVCRHQLYGYVADLPTSCKQRLLEFFSSHDQLFLSECARIVSSASFGRNLTELRFYLSDQLTDNILEAIAAHSRALQQIAIIFCQNVSDKVPFLFFDVNVDIGEAEMVKSLFNICLAAVCRHQLYGYVADLPTSCKQRLLEFFSSHDQLFLSECARIVSSASFGRNLTELRFYLSDQLTDNILEAIAAHSRALQQIAIIFCQNVSDKVPFCTFRKQSLAREAITNGQRNLEKLEFRALKKLTSNGLSLISSDFLHSVDLSSCTQVSPLVE
ncbi:unnamed protein product [Gongylonema pulchrum]|uniref:Uncharacterized protein n=1 Tax=Gongylonema pulchrum TaxID=637853 RepID=A0A183EDR6_9BILA|nr:unnamed protein product [Gongylonema pulchrum]